MEQDSLFVSEGDSKIFINNKFIIVSFKCLFLSYVHTLLPKRFTNTWRWLHVDEKFPCKWFHADCEEATLKNRTFAFVPGRLREFYSGSGASVHPRHSHYFSEYVVHFVIVPSGAQCSGKEKEIEMMSIFSIYQNCQKNILKRSRAFSTQFN